MLNILLARAWNDYVKSLETGELIQLEAKYTSLVQAIVADVVPKGLEGALADRS